MQFILFICKNFTDILYYLYIRFYLSLYFAIILVINFASYVCNIVLFIFQNHTHKLYRLYSCNFIIYFAIILVINCKNYICSFVSFICHNINHTLCYIYIRFYFIFRDNLIINYTSHSLR